jgi:hypothetical protein
MLSRTQTALGEVFYNVIARKNRSKHLVQNAFQKARPEIVDPAEKHEL